MNNIILIILLNIIIIFIECKNKIEDEILNLEFFEKEIKKYKN